MGIKGHSDYPWKKVFEANIEGYASTMNIYSSNDDLVASVYWKQEGNYNANLIAAAPELLDALERLVQEYEYLHRVRHSIGLPMPSIEEIRKNGHLKRAIEAIHLAKNGHARDVPEFLKTLGAEDE